MRAARFDASAIVAGDVADFCRCCRPAYSGLGVDWATVGIFLGSDAYLLSAYRTGALVAFAERVAGILAVLAGILIL